MCPSNCFLPVTLIYAKPCTIHSIILCLKLNIDARETKFMECTCKCIHMERRGGVHFSCSHILGYFNIMKIVLCYAPFSPGRGAPYLKVLHMFPRTSKQGLNFDKKKGLHILYIGLNFWGSYWLYLVRY